MNGVSGTDGGKSVMEPMLNLVCPKGHKWFAPNPKYFVGSECSMTKAGNLHPCKLKLGYNPKPTVGN